MGNIAVRVEGLGKMYRIGGKQERYRTLRDSLTDAVSAPFKRARSLLHGQAYGAAGLEETIWALKDVSFEVKHGEVVGIIGRNGAGKSTLLKILSRITEPTEGYADVYGRVGSLLEVGTGFHPELTGRENIYLNGAILGMSRAEIDRKFDEIVDFAEIERFIDTPVKHYSSGMGLRLGFAVAAHLEPEILVVDEVLAVGDAQFQKKCLGKMSDVAGEGRTVLFVSHNMAAVQRLCTYGICLNNGKIEANGLIRSVVDHYASSVGFRRTDVGINSISTNHFDNIEVAITGSKTTILRPMERAFITVTYTARSSVMNGGVYIGFHTDDDYLLFGLDYRDFDTGPSVESGSTVQYTFEIPELPLMAGDYYLRVHLKNQANDIIEILDQHFPFSVSEGTVNSSRQLSRQWFGVVAVPARVKHSVISYSSDRVDK